MKTTLRFVLTLSIAVGLSVAVARAADKPAPAAAAAPAKGAFQGDLLGVIGFTEKHIMELAEAIPQNKYSWRPEPGVRSVAEAFMHIAFGNYGLTAVATGAKPPADSGFDGNMQKWDTKTTDKAEIKKILEKSFAWSRDTIKAFPDADLDKKVNLFGNQMSARTTLIILAGHVNEHLGQEVAYARSNKITPPWSEAVAKK